MLDHHPRLQHWYTTHASHVGTSSQHTTHVTHSNMSLILSCNALHPRKHITQATHTSTPPMPLTLARMVHYFSNCKMPTRKSVFLSHFWCFSWHDPSSIFFWLFITFFKKEEEPSYECLIAESKPNQKSKIQDSGHIFQG